MRLNCILLLTFYCRYKKNEAGTIVPTKKGIALKKEEFNGLKALLSCIEEEMKPQSGELLKGLQIDGIQTTNSGLQQLVEVNETPTEGEDIIPLEKLCMPKTGVYASCDYYPEPVEPPMKKNKRYFNQLC